MEYVLDAAPNWIIVRKADTQEITFRYNGSDMEGAVEALRGVAAALSMRVSKIPAPPAQPGGGDGDTGGAEGGNGDSS